MTVAEMHILFKLLMDKADTLNYPNFEPEEIDVLLNNEKDKIIEQRAYGTNPKRQGVEETQKRVDDLRNITKHYTSSIFSNNSGNNKTNGYFVNLPSDYKHALQEDLSIRRQDCNGNLVTETVDVIPITHDRYNRIIKDPFHKPDESNILRLPYEETNGVGTFELITNGNLTPLTYHLRYLRDAASIRYGTQYATPTTDVDCDLADHLHREIVESAVRTALENIESRRFPSTNQLLKETE